MIFYIADTHFGHERNIKLCKRPFQSVGEMDSRLIENWNFNVKRSDTVYVLGDFAISDKVATDILPRLNGEKHLVYGNHDTVLNNALHVFKSVSQIATIQDAGRSVCLCHYPLLSYENSVYGGYHVFGHIHNNPCDVASDLQKKLPKSLNCGVDVTGFFPRTLDELIKIKENGYRL